MDDLTHIAVAGSTIAVKVTPKAARNDVFLRDGDVRVTVTTVPGNGKANAAMIKLLAKALGLPKSRLTVIRGQTGRDKVIAIS